MKNVEARQEALEDAHVLDNFTVGNLSQNVKEYLLDLTVDDMRILTIHSHLMRRGETSQSVLAIVLSEAKTSDKKLMSTVN